MFCCYRPFASLYAVRIHTETHNRQNNLKFSCTMCGASYARAFALKDHMKQVHKKDLNSVDNLVEVTIYRNVLFSLRSILSLELTLNLCLIQGHAISQVLKN